MVLRTLLFHTCTQSLKRWLPPLQSILCNGDGIPSKESHNLYSTIESLTDAVGNHLNK